MNMGGGSYLVRHRQSLQSAHVERDDFVAKHLGALSLFIDGTSIAEVRSALSSGAEVPLKALASVLESRVGASLFANEVQILHWERIRAEISAQLDTLVNQNSIWLI